MNQASEYRERAEHARQRAEWCGSPGDKAAWLLIAEQWLGVARDTDRAEEALRKLAAKGYSEWPDLPRTDGYAVTTHWAVIEVGLSTALKHILRAVLPRPAPISSRSTTPQAPGRAQAACAQSRGPGYTAQ